jgi:hypothetical protein
VITEASAGLVDILDVFYNASDAVLNGITVSEDSIYTYARALREGGQFMSVTLNTVTTNEDGSISFIIYITW